MRDLAIICLIILLPFPTEQFCFIVSAEKDEKEFPLATGPDMLPSPVHLDYDSEFITNNYDCTVINHSVQVGYLAMHCCYTLSNLEDEARWNEEKFRDVLKRIYFT